MPSLSNLALYWMRDLVALLLTKTARPLGQRGSKEGDAKEGRSYRGPCLRNDNSW